MNEHDEHRAIHEALTRRTLLAGGAGLGAAGLIAAMPGTAAAASDATTPVVPAGGPGPYGTGDVGGAPAALGTAALPVAVAGAIMRTISATNFVPAGLSSGSSLVGVVPTNGAYNSLGQALFAPLDIPPGSTLKQVDCYAYATNSTTPAGTWSLIRYDTAGGSTTLSSTTPPTGPGLTQRTYSGLSHLVDGTHQIVANLSGSNAAYYAVAVTYQYIAAGTGALTILPAPVRVYDSRPGFLPAVGTKAPMTNGTTRAVDCAFAGTVPAGSVAAMVNLTATGTDAAGFLAAFRNGIAWPGNSTVNWDHAGQTSANQVVVALDGAARFALFCAGSTDVVVDVVGYYR